MRNVVVIGGGIVGLAVAWELSKRGQDVTVLEKEGHWAAHQTGQDGLLRAVVDELCARTARDEVLPRMAPETESLIDDLYPSWRTSVP